MCLLQRRKDRDVFKVSAYTTKLVQFGHEVQETKMDTTILRNPSHSLESCGDNKKVCCIQKLVRLRPFDYRGAIFRSSLPSGAVSQQYDLATKRSKCQVAEKVLERKPNQIQIFFASSMIGFQIK